MLHQGKNLSCRESVAFDIEPELLVLDVVRLQIARVKHPLDQYPQMETFAERSAVSHLAENDRVLVNDDFNA